MRRALSVAGLLIVLALATLAMPAAARRSDQPDPNDAGGRLDLRDVVLDGSSRPTRWKATTFGKWTIGQIWDQGYVIVELDTRRDEAVDHLLIVGSDGTELVGHLYKIRRDGTQVELATIDAEKDGKRSMSFSLALHKLSIGPDRTAYYWAVVSSFVGGECPQTCLDRVPDAGMVEEPLPGVIPSPSPSPSPGP